ncbi:MAG: sensor domain-containing diguanylate cyclase [Candidatus Omnitrophica bacterium]|nr:sensor domain-containing diguanylate cyclase [Candidatus Omnitrophota bacterium]
MITIITLYYFFNAFLKKQSALNLENENLQEKINLTAESIRNSNVTITSLNHKIQRYKSLKGLTEKLGASLSLDETVNLLASETFSLLSKKGNVCILYLLDPQVKKLGIIATRKDEAVPTIKSKVGDIFDNWVLLKLQALLIEDTKKDFRFDLEQMQQKEREFRSLVISPLMIEKKILGVLRIDNPQPGIFNSEDLRFLSTISDLGAVAIENAMLYQHTRELAIRDGLTNLYLRRYFTQQLNLEILRSMRNNSELSLLMLDIDKFKSYNDKFGHIAGDIVLKDISRILSSHFDAPGDIICRCGGEEFAVLLPNLSKKKAVNSAEDLRKKIKDTAIILRKKKTHVSVSIGVASFPADAKINEELIQKADNELLRAKKLGRDRVCHC